MMRRVRLAYQIDTGQLKKLSENKPTPQISAADANKIAMYKKALAMLTG